MPPRTQLLQQLPWNPKLLTSLNEAMIPSNGCTQLDNIVSDERNAVVKREGFNHNYDGQTAGTALVIGQHDFWFGTSGSRSQRKMRLQSDGVVKSDNAGTITTLTVGGTAWSGTLDTCSMITYNNKVIMAVNGTTNNVKYWDGNNSNATLDLYSNAGYKSISRSSSGTSRTIVLNKTVTTIIGTTFVVLGMGSASYNGTFVLGSLSTTTLTNDTITFTGTGALTELSTADTGGTFGGLAPRASILREHLGRIFCNDKTAPDRLHFSPTNDHTLWGGFGDSGAIDIGIGDGDPDGITAIFPSFKGELFVAKRTKLYRIRGLYPEEFTIEKVSDGIGCVSHNSVVALDDDMLFVSDRGVHSLSSTVKFGDFTSDFISSDIQKTFNDSFSKAHLKYVWGAYLNSINSVAFTFTEESGLGRVYTNTTSNNCIYLFNILNKAWYRWPDVSCQSIITANDSDRKRFYLGTHTSRVSQTFTGENYDKTSAGASVAVKLNIVSGTIYVDNSPYSTKGFKRFILYYTPKGHHTIVANIRIDGRSLNSENSLSFSSLSSGTPLGTGFVLGSTPLGSTGQFAAHVRQIDGFGRGVKISIEQNDIDASAEIQGWGLEYEPAGISYEAV